MYIKSQPSFYYLFFIEARTVLRMSDEVKYRIFQTISKSSSTLKELWELFRSIDSDGSGVLTMPEVVLFLKSITDDISTENIEKIFDGLDDSGDRSIDFEEFKVRTPHNKSFTNPNLHLQTVMHNLTDNGWNRCDTKSKESITDEEVRGLFEMIDRDKSGSLTMRVKTDLCNIAMLTQQICTPQNKEK